MIAVTESAKAFRGSIDAVEYLNRHHENFQFLKLIRKLIETFFYLQIVEIASTALFHFHVGDDNRYC